MLDYLGAGLVPELFVTRNALPHCHTLPPERPVAHGISACSATAAVRRCVWRKDRPFWPLLSSQRWRKTVISLRTVDEWKVVGDFEQLSSGRPDTRYQPFT